MGQTMRQEHDSIGTVDVPTAALWGAQTQRSLNNFAIGDQRIPAELIHALARIKQCCAVVNGRHAC
jgi:fumarate hydratase class II